MPIIYIDELFAINFMINFLLLGATGALTHARRRLWRLCLSAAVGAVYAVCIFFPNLRLLYTALSKLLVSVLMVAVAFPLYSVRSAVKTVLLFYVVSFGFGGCVMAAALFGGMGERLGAVISNGVFYFDIPAGFLLLCAAAAYGLIRVGAFVMRRAMTRDDVRRTVYIRVAERTAKIDGILDTGNALFDPTTARPVIVAELDAVRDLLPPSLAAALRTWHEEDLDALLCAADGFRLRLIPFTSVGREKGLLPGFVPDGVQLQSGDALAQEVQCVVGISTHPLAPDNSYHALLNPHLSN